MSTASSGRAREYKVRDALDADAALAYLRRVGALDVAECLGLAS